MIAIKTYYMGPTNHRGSRIVALAKGAASGQARMVLDWNQAKDSYWNHQNAAQALATANGWNGHWVAGHNEDGSQIWVNTNPNRRPLDTDFSVLPA